MKTVGVIGGSGLYEIESLSNVEEIELDTPLGKPSDAIISSMPRIGLVTPAQRPFGGPNHASTTLTSPSITHR